MFSKISYTPSPRHKKKLYVYKATDESLRLGDVTLSIINGLDVSMIDPDLFPCLYSYLKSSYPHTRAINIAGSNNIVKAIKFIENEFSKMQIIEREQSSMAEPDIPVTEEEVDSAFDSLMSGGDPYKIETRITPQLFKKLIVMRRKYIEEKDYMNAEVASNAINSLVSAKEANEKSNEHETRIRDLETRKEKLENVLLDIQKKWNDDIDSMKIKIENELDKIREENKEKLSQAKEQLKEKLPPKYNKHSPRVLALRVQYQSMPDPCSADALLVKKDLDNATMAENENNRRNYVEHINDTILQIEEDGARREAAKRMMLEETIRKKENLMNAESANVKKAILHIEKEIEEQKKAVQSTRNKSKNNDNSISAKKIYSVSLPLLKQSRKYTNRSPRRTVRGF